MDFHFHGRGMDGKYAVLGAVMDYRQASWRDAFIPAVCLVNF
jgi:hypothetical protein